MKKRNIERLIKIDNRCHNSNNEILASISDKVTGLLEVFGVRADYDCGIRELELAISDNDNFKSLPKKTIDKIIPTPINLPFYTRMDYYLISDIVDQLEYHFQEQKKNDNEYRGYHADV